MVELRFIDIQAVSDFPHGANVERGIWISPIQLLAQVADMKTYCIVLISCGEIAPDLFVNLCIGQHMAFIGGQQQENPIFFCGKLNLLSIPKDLSSARKNLKTGERYHRFFVDLDFFYLRVVFEDRQNLLQNFRISFVAAPKS